MTDVLRRVLGHKKETLKVCLEFNPVMKVFNDVFKLLVGASRSRFVGRSVSNRKILTIFDIEVS